MHQDANAAEGGPPAAATDPPVNGTTGAARPAAPAARTPPDRAAIRINIDQLHIALVWRDPDSTYYLDLHTGEIFLHHFNKDLTRDAEVKDGVDRYLPIRAIDPKHSYQAVADFVEFLPNCAVRDELRKIILGKGAFRRFKDYIAQHAAEKELWLIFKEQREMTYVDQWLAALPFPHEPFDPYAERRKARLASLDGLRNKRIRVRRVDHVHVRAVDLEEARRFYQDLLQLVPLEPSPDRRGLPPSCWFRCGNVEVHVVQDAAAAASVAETPLLAFEVASLAQARSALEAAGIAPGPECVAAGRKGFVVQDPTGNRIELMEPGAVA